MVANIDHNNIFQLASDCINYSNRSVFLTGKAGTGKTTFLKFIREHTQKQTAVIAPTGVAAINAGGTTIHSFFQLPFTPYIPERRTFEMPSATATDKHHLLGRLRYNSERIQLLQELELLIIDEISMVRCDVLDAVDVILRHYRNRNHEVFGGVQMLLIGDMFQLPPVAIDQEWKILSSFYKSPYFFDSLAIQQQPPLHIELEKIYRQSDSQFISLLNKIRNNEMDEESGQLLLSRYKPGFQPTKNDGYITLTTHNYLSDNINNTEIQQLSGDMFEFKAIIEKEFGEKMYPAEELLKLKIGAQVMFLKNDMEKIRRYFNGKIGTVKKIEDDKIYVQCGEEKEIEVSRYKWENIRYTLNTVTQKMEEEVIGSFEQYPLRLAWAITIHKSQGLTFEKAVIDAGAAFAPGQVYVALSRCTSLEGIILRSPITRSALFTDPRIIAFGVNKAHAIQLSNELREAKHSYQRSLVKDLFNLSAIVKMCARLLDSTEEHRTAFNEETFDWLQNIAEKTEALQIVAEKFQPQLDQLLQQPELPEESPVLQGRIKSAAAYFTKELQQLSYRLQQSPAVTDSRQYALAFNEDLKNIHIAISKKNSLLHSCINGFNVNAYMQQKNNFIVPSFNVNAYAKASSYTYRESPHPALLKQLRKLRDEICDKNNLPIYIVAGSDTLDEMARYLPQTLDELLLVNGFGKAKIEKYGQGFVNIITEYCAEHKLSSLIHEKTPKRQRKEKKEPKPDTKLESYKLFKEGRKAEEIAATRNLTKDTIETHLAHYIKTGAIKIDELLAREKFVLIEPFVKTHGAAELGIIKQKLGSNASYGEIKLVLAWKEFENSDHENLQEDNDD